MTYVYLVLAWFIYFALHTVLADFRVKNFFHSHLPGLRNWYRLIYNIIALSGLLLLIYFSFLQDDLLWKFQSWHWIPALVIGVPGLIIMGLSARTFDLPEFLGLRQSDAMNKGASESGLIQTGMYAYVRHPLYSGTILFVGSVLLIFPFISVGIFFLSMLVYLPIGMYFEERKLIQEYGDAYKAYREEVARLIPGLY